MENFQKIVIKTVYKNLYLIFVHCNPLQGNYRVELLHREIPIVITGNGFSVSREFIVNFACKIHLAAQSDIGEQQWVTEFH